MSLTTDVENGGKWGRQVNILFTRLVSLTILNLLCISKCFYTTKFKQLKTKKYDLAKRSSKHPPFKING
jgi:hypothetical protein